MICSRLFSVGSFGATGSRARALPTVERFTPRALAMTRSELNVLARAPPGTGGSSSTLQGARCRDQVGKRLPRQVL
jgi:hypothetical protein